MLKLMKVTISSHEERSVCFLQSILSITLILTCKCPNPEFKANKIDRKECVSLAFIKMVLQGFT